MTKITILDLDNTISNDEWRISQIDWSTSDPKLRYHRYHQLSHADKAGNHDLFVNKSVVIFTARPEKYRDITIEWLAANAIDAAMVLMRCEGDHRPSKELKLAMFKHLRGFYSMAEIEGAYDDREDVVQMYRSLGLNAHVRALHDTCAYTRPCPSEEDVAFQLLERRLIAAGYTIEDIENSSPYNKVGDES